MGLQSARASLSHRLATEFATLSLLRPTESFRRAPVPGPSGCPPHAETGRTGWNRWVREV